MFILGFIVGLVAGPVLIYVWAERSMSQEEKSDLESVILRHMDD